ncbi:sodium/proline symporter [Caldalkalibacillus salinus]|uniref:sodium/proline symporter n=1 Tax=Caldalkalibacillus salinus TaxID=2803787 RepID=UPI00192361E3|nr:sodium/proline symporter [Caldalkalibacillus salinus]
MDAHPLTAMVLGLYLLILLAIGYTNRKKSAGGLTDFFLAGRKLGKWTVALSAVSSGRSGWLVLGVTGIAYAEGFQAVWALAGFITVEVFMFFYAARRFRKYSALTGSITIPDMLEARFQDQTNILRVVSSLIIIFFMIAYVGSQVVAGGTAFSSSLGLTTSGGMLLTAAIILIYTMLGGFHAVSKTDILQIFFMLLSVVILPLIAIIKLGGFGPILEAMHQQGGGFVDPFAFSFGVALSLVGVGFGSPGNPHIIVRYMSLKSLKDMRQAALIGSIWNVVIGWGAIMVGLAGRAYFPDISMLPDGNREAIFTTLGAELMPPIFMGVLLVAILAAIMSSADSQLLVGSSSVVRDIYDKLIGKGKVIPQKTLVLYSRLSILLIMGLAILLAFSAQEFVFWMVLFAWGGLGACFGPALLLSLYWKRVTKAGVLSGMMIGLITVILVKEQPVWTYMFLPDVQQMFSQILFGITYEAVPGFLMSLLVTVVVSLFTKKPDHADQTLEQLGQ